MKLTSLFKDKAYAFSQAGDPENDCEFAANLISKIKPKFNLKEIMLWGVTEYCDIFLLSNEKRECFKLKFSLSDPRGLLKREVTSIRSLGSNASPSLVKHGETELGEPISYLMTKVPAGESVRNIGRSHLMEKVDDFINAYWQFSETRPVRQSYTSVIKEFADDLIPENCIDEAGLQAVKKYTDYDFCEKFLLDLRTQIIVCSDRASAELNHKCHGALGIDSIFYYEGEKQGFYFDDLYNVSKGHPYIDFLDLIFDLGVPPEMDIRLWKRFCEIGGFPQNRDLFHVIYEMQVRKKLADLLICYIREVYLYNSYRYQRILEIADSFSHCYSRFCKLPIFSEKRDFFMKTICEPIFGVKA
jgi:hypothetical protein